MIKRKRWLLLLLCLINTAVIAQPTHTVTNSENLYQQAGSYFYKGDYALAYPLLRELRQQNPAEKKSDHIYLNDDVDCWFIICELNMQLSSGERDAVHYIASGASELRKGQLSFYLAHYYFLQDDFENAAVYYSKVKFDNLTNAQIANAKFEHAYASFALKDFAVAKPLFNEVKQIAGHPNRLDAAYYYGYISFHDKEYPQSLEAFRSVASVPAYAETVPYFIAEILYAMGQKKEALQYGDSALSANLGGAYRNELLLLTAQLYFEKQQYREALPLFVEYANGKEKMAKEILYELSYCYFKTGNNKKAIEGFRYLSNEKDSLGQNSMYILGDLYLQAKDKANARTAFQFCASNNSDPEQQRISRLNYAKLSYELGYQDIALAETRRYLSDYAQYADDRSGENLFGHVQEAKELLISLMSNTNNFDEGLALFKTLNQSSPEARKVYARLLYGKAIQLVNDQRLSEADELFAQLIALNNAPQLIPYASFWRGEIAYRQQRYDESIRFLNNFLDSHAPGQAEANITNANYNLGYDWFQQQQYKNALKYFEVIAASLRPVTSALEQDAFVRSADCYFMQRDFAKANAMYDQVAKSNGAQADYALYQMAIIAGVKNSTEKIRLLTALISKYPSSSLALESMIQLALTYIDDQQFKQAIPYLNEMIGNEKASSYRPLLYFNLGLCHYNLNSNQEALKAFRFLLQQYPQSSETDQCVSMIRNIYIEDGNPDGYVSLMKEHGIKVDVNEADSLSYVAAGIKYEAGDCPLAISSYKNYLSRYPAGAYVLDANYRIGLCAQKQKDSLLALQSYDAVFQKGISRYFEAATLEAARIAYFQVKDYAAARKYFEALSKGAVNPEKKMEALRGLVRCYFQLKDFSSANVVATELISGKGASQDDKAISFLVLGRSRELAADTAGAIQAFRSAISLNKSAWGAEARYALAANLLAQNDLAGAEKAAMAVIKETGSYENWVIRSYLLLGDIFMKQKDYFNAKATYESVAQNASIPELKTEAQQKLDNALQIEKQNSKIGTP